MPTGINDLDQVIGTQSFPRTLPPFTDPTTDHAVLWATDGSTVDLLGKASVPNAISASGQVVGAMGASPVHAFSWVAGTTTDLGTLGGASSTAIAVNAAGQIVGASLTPTGETHAFIWESGTMTDLGTLGGNASIAVAINSSGQVAGSSTTASGAIHAFIWKAGTMTDLGTLGGSGSVAGPVTNQSEENLATQSIRVNWTFGSVSMHRAISEAGQIVGASLTAAGETHIFLWQAGSMRDLGASGSTFLGQVAISPSGVVAGNSTAGAFVFDPITCPGP